MRLVPLQNAFAPSDFRKTDRLRRIYLTWRDSKTAIVYFMNTKEMAAPLKAIEEFTSQHPCFLKLNSRKEASWFDYTFHLPGDEGVSIRLTILCFHLPKRD